MINRINHITLAIKDVEHSFKFCLIFFCFWMVSVPCQGEICVLDFLEFMENEGDMTSRGKLKFFSYKDVAVQQKGNELCAYCTPNDKNSATIAFTKHWKIILAFNQAHLGRTLVIPTRHFGTYEEMAEEESWEYSQIFKDLLPALQKAFQVSNFNISYMMNWAYNPEKQNPPFVDGKPSPHFHWHIVPRYDSFREFNKERFEDPDFGNPYDHYRSKSLSPDIFKCIIQAIQAQMNIDFLP